MAVLSAVPACGAPAPSWAASPAFALAQAQALLPLLSTRTLNDFAAEARLDAESLSQAVARYEIDYAWSVLGSERLLGETLSALAQGLAAAPDAQQAASVAQVLRAASAAQQPESLMSYDNDVPQQLSGLLLAAWAGAPEPSPA